jgi:GR25 family glycosyltransferase involved in LPS biosynthesis
MKLDFKSIKKVVINLKRRPDRLEKFKEEMAYIGWEYEIFEGIDTGDYNGCAFSHKKIAEDFLETNDDFLLVMEDDLFFMPYSKKVIQECEDALNNVEWEFFHFGPSIHRPLKRFNDILIDLNNLPPKDETRHRGIFGTTGFILTKKSAEIMANWDTSKYIENGHRQIPIDEYMDKVLYKKCRSFCPYLLLTTQHNDYSDINKTFDNNHYILTYNWNAYLPDKLSNIMMDFDYCKNNR